MTVINSYPPNTTENDYKLLAYQAHILLSMMKLNTQNQQDVLQKNSNEACCNHEEDT